MKRPNDEDDLYGSEDDWDEDNNELGIDYELIDPNVVSAMGQGRAPIIAEVVPNPAPIRKVLEKSIADLKFDRKNRIALVTFIDGSQLVIRPE